MFIVPWEKVDQDFVSDGGFLRFFACNVNIPPHTVIVRHNEEETVRLLKPSDEGCRRSLEDLRYLTLPAVILPSSSAMRSPGKGRYSHPVAMKCGMHVFLRDKNLFLCPVDQNGSAPSPVYPESSGEVPFPSGMLALSAGRFVPVAIVGVPSNSPLIDKFSKNVRSEAQIGLPLYPEMFGDFFE
jgi:hypothetical protein